MYSFEIYQNETGFGFNILHDGGIVIVQDFAPDKDGFQSMSESEAIQYAEIVVARMEA